MRNVEQMKKNKWGIIIGSRDLYYRDHFSLLVRQREINASACA